MAGAPLLKSIKGDARHLARQIAFDETLPTSWPAADDGRGQKNNNY